MLFFLTAIAEIVGCFLPYLWLRKKGSVWLLVPAAFSLAMFVWLLTLHPAASVRSIAFPDGLGRCDDRLSVWALLWWAGIRQIRTDFGPNLPSNYHNIK